MAPRVTAGRRRRRHGRVCVLAVVVLALLASVSGADAPHPVRVGILKLTSSAPVFVGVEKGFFKEFDVEPQLTYFQAAAPIATALAAGQVDVGATGLTAALYNIVLGGQTIWIAADKGREWPGYPLTAIVVQKELYGRGVRAVADLRGRRIGITQLGSTFHYHLGRILEKEGMKLEDVRVVPLQAMGAALEALRGRRVDAVMLPQPFPATAEAEGFGRILAWGGDLFAWQAAAVFYSKRFAADRPRAIAFMKGYVKAARYYHDAVLGQRDGRPSPGAHHDEVVAITAKYTGAWPEIIRVGFPYVDRNGRLLVEDIGRQLEWWRRHGFMKAALPVNAIVDTSFVEEAVKALGE